jgi:hypothetical protein
VREGSSPEWAETLCGSGRLRLEPGPQGHAKVYMREGINVSQEQFGPGLARKVEHREQEGL